MSHLLAIDPGLSSGIFLGHYSDTEPLTRVGLWQFGDKSDPVRGVDALLDWINEHWHEHDNEAVDDFGWYGGLYQYDDISFQIEKPDLTIICEKFTPLQNQGHSLTLDAVEPLRCEGALIALGLLPAEFPNRQWRRPAVMYWAGGADLPAKKKASRAWLKSHGLLPTGKTVGQPNADDAVSATLHAFSYMRNTVHHQPTLDYYWGEKKEEA